MQQECRLLLLPLRGKQRLCALSELQDLLIAAGSHVICMHRDDMHPPLLILACRVAPVTPVGARPGSGGGAAGTPAAGGSTAQTLQVHQAAITDLQNNVMKQQKELNEALSHASVAQAAADAQKELAAQLTAAMELIKAQSRYVFALLEVSCCSLALRANYVSGKLHPSCPAVTMMLIHLLVSDICTGLGRTGLYVINM